MKKAADILTWTIGIFEILGIWLVCIIYYVIFKTFDNYSAWWLIVIPLVMTIVILGLAGMRQLSINEGEGFIKWGIITLLFISVPGGILTMCLNNSYSYRPRRTYYNSKPSSNSSSIPSTTSSSYVEQNNQTEKKELNQFIFVEPTNEIKIEKGMIIKVKQGFYISSIYERVNTNEECEVLEVNSDDLVVIVRRSESSFRAIVKKDNILVRIKNPAYVEEQKKEEEAKKEAVLTKTKVESENKKVNEAEKIKFLREYKQLLDEGVITKEEFEAKKKELL